MKKHNPETWLVGEVPTNHIDIADGDTHQGVEIPYGIDGWASGVLSIENGLDQTVTVVIHGRNAGEDTWQDATEDVDVAAGATGVLGLPGPWAQVRVSAYCLVAASSGTLSCYLTRVRAAGVSASSLLPTNVRLASITGVDGQATMALSLPTVEASDSPFVLAIGATTDAAVVTDAVGSLSGKIRGLVRWAFERMPASLGQKLMAASLPTVEASDTPFAVAIGTTADAAVVTDTTGTLIGFLRGLVKWAFERMPASLGQKAMDASLPVVIASNQSALALSAGEAHIGEVGCNTTVVSVTPTVTAGGYTALDIVGAIQTIAAATRVSGEPTILLSITVTELNKQNVELTIFFFNANPGTGTYTDNIALTIHDTDMALCIGEVQELAADYRSASASSVATVSNIGLPLMPAATSLFAIAQASSAAPTYASTSDLTLRYSFLRD